MKASEAKDLVIQFHSYDDMTVIFSNIEVAAKQGLTKVNFFAPSVTKTQIQILVDSGYHVSRGYKSDSLEVKW